VQMKQTYFSISVFLACCIVSFLTGCQLQPSWYLNAHKEGDTVQLCLSNEGTCPQPDGVSPAGISVYRYDSMHDNELVWDADPDNPITHGRIDGIVTYGIPPKNWRNKLTPPALVCGKAYLVNPGALFFALKCDGTVVVFDSQHLEQFFRGDPVPEPTKKRPGY
jgi:hypothetical protein